MGRLIAQLAAFAAFALAVGALAVYPRYEVASAGEGALRLSIAAPGRILGECRRLTPAELAARAPNMRAELECPRERSPLRVRLEVDGDTLYEAALPPSGIARDGNARAYRLFPLAAGRHELFVQVSDDERVPGYAFQRRVHVDLAPGQLITVDFQRERGGVLIL